MDRPLEIFFSYAHEDEGLMNDVRRQLIVYERNGRILKWHDRMISPGAEWRGQIDVRLEAAQIVLLFMSPHFIESRYCYEVEGEVALRRHEAGQARVGLTMVSFSDADAAAIRSQIDMYAQTALAADWDAWGQTLAPDVIALPPNSPPIMGRDAAIAFARTYPKLTRLVETVDEVVGELAGPCEHRCSWLTAGN